MNSAANYIVFAYSQSKGQIELGTVASKAAARRLADDYRFSLDPDTDEFPSIEICRCY
jgi:hypothetical protein